MSFMSIRIYEQLEELICDERQKHRKPCYCAKLRKNYGSKIFKCTFPSCEHSRRGFDTFRARRVHVEHHARPWKCYVPSCEFAIIGFAKQRGRDEHWRKMHHIAKPLELKGLGHDGLSRDDFEVLLFELTKAGDVDGLQRISSHMERYFRILGPARLLAAKLGSQPMVEILCQWDDDWLNYQGTAVPYYSAIVKSGSTDLFRWLLGKMGTMKHIRDYGRLAGEVFATNCPDMYTEWENFLLDPTRPLGSGNTYYSDGYAEWDPSKEFRAASKLIQQHNKRSVLFSKGTFTAVGRNAIFEARLMQTWHRLIGVLGGGPLNPKFLGWSFTCLGRSSSPSMVLAAELLRLGAPLDFPRGKGGTITPKTERSRQKQPLPSSRSCSDGEDGKNSPAGYKRQRGRRSRHKGMTALHFALKRTSEGSARLARFLLEQGANPDYGYAGVKPAQERGAVLMQKWLGETWEEMLERTKPARLERMKQDGVEGLEDTNDDEEEVPRAKRHKWMAKSRERDGSDDGMDDESDGEIGEQETHSPAQTIGPSR
jgi:hypothetical protein